MTMGPMRVPDVDPPLSEVERLRAELEQARKERDDAVATRDLAMAQRDSDAFTLDQRVDEAEADARRFRDALERIAAFKLNDAMTKIARDALAGDK